MNVLRIHRAGPSIDAELLERFRGCPSRCTLGRARAECRGRRSPTGRRLPLGARRPFGRWPRSDRSDSSRGQPGCAHTRHSIWSRPGDVLVVDAHGDLESSIMGDLMTRYAMSREVAAVVIDGAVRDRDFISPVGTSRSSRGASPTSVPTNSVRGRSTFRSPLAALSCTTAISSSVTLTE